MQSARRPPRSVSRFAQILLIRPRHVGRGRANSDSYDHHMRTLAIDIGGTKTAAGLVDNGEIVEHASWPTPASDGASHVLAEVINRTQAWAKSVERCGVSFGGPFDFTTQTCVGSMHVPGWQGMRLSEELSRALDVTVVTDNDANVAALGEYAAAAGTERNPMLYVTLSTGVG